MVRLTEVTIEPAYLLLQLTATAPTASCPHCAVPSSAVHSRYQRCLTDLPWGTRPVRIQADGAKIRLPESDLQAPHLHGAPAGACRAIRPQYHAAHRCPAGARLAARLWLSTSAATLLRLVRAALVPHTPALQAVGVDEWAWRRGRRFGTILVDLASHRILDLLPERSAAAVAAWLAQHPTISVVCRDRSPLYADGIRQGVPDAVQVVDRFYLVDNLHKAVEAFLTNQRGALQAAAVCTAQALTPPESSVPVTPMYQGRRRSAQPQQRRADAERQPRPLSRDL
jgi:transposase